MDGLLLDQEWEALFGSRSRSQLLLALTNRGCHPARPYLKAGRQSTFGRTQNMDHLNYLRRYISTKSPTDGPRMGEKRVKILSFKSSEALLPFWLLLLSSSKVSISNSTVSVWQRILA